MAVADLRLLFEGPRDKRAIRFWEQNQNFHVVFWGPRSNMGATASTLMYLSPRLPMGGSAFRRLGWGLGLLHTRIFPHVDRTTCHSVFL